MYTRPWTPDEVLHVRRCLAEGATYKEVAQELSGRTWTAVRQLCYRLRIGSGREGAPPDVYRRSQILQLVTEGFRLYQIAGILNLHPSTVQDLAARMQRDGILSTVKIGRHTVYRPATDKEMRRGKKTRLQQAQAEAPADQRKHSA